MRDFVSPETLPLNNYVRISTQFWLYLSGSKTTGLQERRLSSSQQTMGVLLSLVGLMLMTPAWRQTMPGGMTDCNVFLPLLREENIKNLNILISFAKSSW